MPVTSALSGPIRPAICGAAAGSAVRLQGDDDVILRAGLGRIGEAARTHGDGLAAADQGDAVRPASPPDAARAR